MLHDHFLRPVLSKCEVESRADLHVRVVTQGNIRRSRFVDHGGSERYIAGNIVLQSEGRRVDLILPAGIEPVGEPECLDEGYADNRPSLVEFGLDCEYSIEGPAAGFRQIAEPLGEQRKR